jgi:hypothetical protein
VTRSPAGETKCDGILWCDNCWAPLAPEHHLASTEVFRLCQVCRLVQDGKFGDEPVEEEER